MQTSKALFASSCIVAFKAIDFAAKVLILVIIDVHCRTVATEKVGSRKSLPLKSVVQAQSNGSEPNKYP